MLVTHLKETANKAPTATKRIFGALLATNESTLLHACKPYVLSLLAYGVIILKSLSRKIIDRLDEYN